MKNVLGTRIKNARETTGLSQGAFARGAGLSSEYISKLEAGKRTPSFATLSRIAAYLNKEISYFFEEKESGFEGLRQIEEEDKLRRPFLKRFRRYCEDYLHLEQVAGRRLELGPVYSHVSPERMADEERRRLGLGNEPIRDIFFLCESNGCRIFRMPVPEEYKVAGVFVYLEAREAAFALINSGQTLGQQAFVAAHEYGHYLKDRYESPVIDNPDVFVSEYVSLYHPREQFAQSFAACFMISPAKVKEIVKKDLHSHRISFEQVLYLKRYFGVSTPAMLQALRNLDLISIAQMEEFRKINPVPRETDIFGPRTGSRELLEDTGSGSPARRRGRTIFSDRYKLLSREAERLNKG
jgi:transcriptional regulator with XRE-family HTH domain